MPSQWALQYFPFSGAGQVQAAFAHFLGLAIILLCRFLRRPLLGGTLATMRKPTQHIVAQNHRRTRAKSACAGKQGYLFPEVATGAGSLCISSEKNLPSSVSARESHEEIMVGPHSASKHHTTQLIPLDSR